MSPNSKIKSGSQSKCKRANKQTLKLRNEMIDKLLPAKTLNELNKMKLLKKITKIPHFKNTPPNESQIDCSTLGNVETLHCYICMKTFENYNTFKVDCVRHLRVKIGLNATGKVKQKRKKRAKRAKRAKIIKQTEGCIPIFDEDDKKKIIAFECGLEPSVCTGVKFMVKELSADDKNKIETQRKLKLNKDDLDELIFVTMKKYIDKAKNNFRKHKFKEHRKKK
eukprot:279567_1